MITYQQRSKKNFDTNTTTKIYVFTLWSYMDTTNKKTITLSTMPFSILEQTKKEAKTMNKTKIKKLQYMVIDIGDISETTETRTKKILNQIPKGKTIVLTDEDLSLPQSEIVVKVIDNEDIPKPTRKRGK